MTQKSAAPQGNSLPWAGKFVRIEEVERQLSLLWHMSADNMRTAQNLHVRTSVLNLVVCAPNLATAKAASTQLRDLSGSSSHFARVTVLILDQSASDSDVSAWVTLRCFSVISDIIRHCFEQTTIQLSGGAVNSAATIVQPLLKPDLPVYLWWLGDLPSNHAIFDDLAQLSQRVIVDSHSFYSSEQDIKTLVSFMDAAPDCAISDLGWGRLAAWRELIAQFFDNAETRPYLDGLDHVVIEHAVVPDSNGETHSSMSINPTRALLLAGWMAKSLGWTLLRHNSQGLDASKPGVYHWYMTRVQNDDITPVANPPVFRIDILPIEQTEDEVGAICSFGVSSHLDGKQATFSISRKDDPEHFLTQVNIPDETRPSRTVNIAARPEGDLFNEELTIQDHDQPFEDALHQIRRILD